MGALLKSLFNDGYARNNAWSLLNNAPLRELLSEVIRFDRLEARLAANDLAALSITALGYTSGASLSFFQGNDLVHGWRRHRRIGVRARLNLDHLMASTAIPGIYPAVPIHREYFGDGAIRQTAPLSPALHLGAKRLFVIGVSHNPNEPEDRRDRTLHPPSIAQMTTHLLNGSFIDALEEDMEDLQRLNRVADKLSATERATLNLAKVDVMSITPSKAFDEVAAKHIDVLPASMRFLFGKVGATRAGGGTSLASYLLFESVFIQELIDCGYNDAIGQSDDIRAFLAG
jgi:NTE family protein